MKNETTTMTRERFFDAVTPGAGGRYGAPMGRGTWPADIVGDGRRYPGEPTAGPSRETLSRIPRRFYLRAVPLDAGGYDTGGAYWGHSFNGETLYAAYAPPELLEVDGETLELDAARVFIRARNRDHAKKETLATFPGARFFDGARGPVVPSGLYCIALEWCGEPSPRWVVRCRGEWVGQRETLEAAETLAETHNRGRG